MKLKSKLVLAASALLVLSGAAAGTGAYAWFTANTIARIGVDQVTVNTPDDLRMAVTLGNADESTKLAVGTDNTVYNISYKATESDPATKANCLRDVSGNGTTMYYRNGDSYAVIPEYKAPYLFEFNVTLTKGNADGKSMYVFLSHTTTFTNTTTSAPADADPKLEKAARIAILNSTDSSLLTYVAPFDDYSTADNTNNTTKFVSAVSAGTPTLAEVSTLNPTGTGALTKVCDTATYFDGAQTDAGIITGCISKEAAAVKTTQGYIGEITSGGSLAVKVRIWLEGQDSDCINKALDQNFKTSLSFLGISDVKATA